MKNYDTKKTLFTITVACYGTEPYLATALDSLLNQTYGNFEVICYVEESPDKSLEICRKYASKDVRFTVVEAQKSGAVSSTRNYGIDHAKGEYLLFLDGDDWIAPNTLSEIDRRLQETGEVDVLEFALDAVEMADEHVLATKRMSNFRPEDEHRVFSGLTAIRKVWRNGAKMHNYACIAAYRTLFLRDNGLYQLVGRIMEDFEWTPRVWFSAARMAYIDQAFYSYRRRKGSITSESSSRIIYDISANLKSLLEFVRRNEIPDDVLAIFAHQWIALLYWFLYHPVSSAKIADTDRTAALKQLFAEGDDLRKLVKRLTRSRKLLFPLVALSAKGACWPARFVFRRIYYPLLTLRDRGCCRWPFRRRRPVARQTNN